MPHDSGNDDGFADRRTLHLAASRRSGRAALLKLLAELHGLSGSEASIAAWAGRIEARSEDPFRAAEALLETLAKTLQLEVVGVDEVGWTQNWVRSVLVERLNLPVEARSQALKEQAPAWSPRTCS